MLLLHLVEDLGLCRRRGDAVDENVRRRQFLGERLRQPDQPRLRCRIMRGIGIAVLARDRGDVDDAAIAVLQHFRHDRAASQIRTDEIDINDAPPDIRLQLPELAVAAGDAGVVDEDVDLAVPRDGGLRGGAHRSIIGEFDDIAGNRAQRGQTGLRRIERLRVDIPEHYGRAGGEHALGSGIADAPRAARDDGHAAFKIDLVQTRSPSARARRIAPARAGLVPWRGLIKGRRRIVAPFQAGSTTRSTVPNPSISAV